MSSPLPVNAKQHWRQLQRDDEDSGSSTEQPLSRSVERAITTARLGHSPVLVPRASSPVPDDDVSGLYGGTADLERVFTGNTTHSAHLLPPSAAGIDLFRPLSVPSYHYEDNTISADLSDDKIAEVVKRHLAGAASPSASTRSSSPRRGTSHRAHNDLSRVSTRNSNNNDPSIHNNQQASTSTPPHPPFLGQPMARGGSGSDENQEADAEAGLVAHAHQFVGSAITHDIYKWAEDVESEQSKRMRSQSMYIPRQQPSDPALARLRDPGGFRRHFVVDRANRQGREPPHWMTRSFVDFLALYGHFGGEDLSDDEGEDDDDDMGRSMPESSSTGDRRRPPGRDGRDDDDETTPLIRKAQANAVQGTATPAKAVFLLLKCFVGTGVMFLPKAFANGGLFFATGLLAAIAGISLYAFLLLVQTRNKVPVSFGDIGGILFGKYMRMAVLVCITFSQIGFVCAYMVFVAQNMQALVETLSNCSVRLPISYLILGQIVLFVPLAMIRKIQKLSSFALVADVFILMGLICLYYYDFSTLATMGVGEVNWFINLKSFPLFIGTAVFSFEGVGLGKLIPITESMKEPHKFPRVLALSMIGITFIFLSVGFLSYLAFGNQVQTVILLNLPANPAVNTVQGLYALAICLSIPLQLFPAIRIAETALFSRSGKHNWVVKWQKNVFRLAMVMLCASIAIAGSDDLDKFVSLVGATCCVPLCFLFPPLFHMKAIASTWREKAIDVAILVFGICSMTYTTGITIALWSAGGDELPISRCLP
ncbi:transmembrane amino acid transporter protein-domain-containing protein [Gongronella butleri]|nr:transmembrane amino acid transporter protein-domain-containing protein [Gongronella butleri]